MLGKIKDTIQGRLYKKCIDEYERALRCQTDPYLLWIKENEQASGTETREEQRTQFDIVYMEDCGAGFPCRDLTKILYCLCRRMAGSRPMSTVRFHSILSSIRM